MRIVGIVGSLREQASNAALISTPEYAHGMPGALKNELDWLVSDARFEGKRVAVICASASTGEYAFHSLLEVLRTMSARVVEGATLSVLGVRSKFAANAFICVVNPN